jgi:alpha-beta hydrolase superfamily lysophospholipase
MPDLTRRPAPVLGIVDDPSRIVGMTRLLVPILAVIAVAVGVHRVEPAEAGAFYDPPNPLPPGPAGTLIRHEHLDRAPAGARAWRILYVSSDPEGEPIAVSGTVFAPLTPDPPGGRPVIAWAHPTTGVASRCAPSLHPGAGADAIPGLSALLAAGYVVTATDYPGLGTPGPHPYLVGESEGRAVLDAIRAARALTNAGGDAPAVLWGHSQGGHAALFAGQLAADYAPDIRLVGIATAAPATDLTALLQHDIGGVAGNVLASMALVSWADVHADRGLSLDQVVEPVSVPIARRIAGRCIESRTQLLVGLPDAEVLRLRFLHAQPWNVEGWDTLLTENTPGASPIGVPVLVNQGTDDTIVWRDVTAAWVAGRCAEGDEVTLVTYDGATHLTIADESATAAVTWITDRVEGRPATGCDVPAELAARG